MTNTDVETNLDGAQDFDYFFTKINATEPTRTHFQNLQLLNKGIDVVTKMSHALQLNIDVLSLLSEETIRRSIIEGEKSAQRYQQFQQAVRMCLTEQSFFKKHVDLLQTFADRRSLQVGPLFSAVVWFLNGN